jgi:thiamine biosynthesis lipoprotein
MEIETFRAMNSEIVLLAETDSARAETGFAAVRNFIEASERRFTRFSEESELSSLNRSAGHWFQASPDLFEVIKEALFYFHKTNGLFDPSILPSLRHAGYVQSMDEIRRLGAAPQAAPQPVSPLPAFSSAFDSIKLNEADATIRLPADMQIDLGGIAKGWIAERAARLLNQYTPACAVSAGGDMFLIDYPDGRDFWEVGLEDPRNPQVDLLVLEAREGAIATSSVVKRAWKQGGVSRHHLIDPRTGEPANTAWLSVTVLAPHVTAAETFAKAFLLADEIEVQQLAEQNPELTALAVDRDGNLVSLVKPREGLHVS